MDEPNSLFGGIGAAMGNGGAGVQDINSSVKGAVQNLGLLATLATGVIGGSLGGTTVPLMTIATAVGTASQLVIAANTARISITFHSPHPSNATMYLSTQSITAVAGRGLALNAGSTVNLPSTCGWNAIATTGATAVLTVMEFM